MSESELETKKNMLSLLLSEVSQECYRDGIVDCIMNSTLCYDIPELLAKIDKKMTEKYGDIR